MNTFMSSNTFICSLLAVHCIVAAVGLHCHKRSEWQIIRVPYYRYEMTVVKLVYVRNVLINICGQSVSDIALNQLLRKIKSK